MSNSIDQETLVALLQGKLAFKVYDKDTSQWKVLKIHVPELDTHAGSMASTSEAGHVMLVTSLENQSETLGATAKSVYLVNQAITAHVNESDIHITGEERIKWNGYGSSENIGFTRPDSASTNVKEAIDELFEKIATLQPSP